MDDFGVLVQGYGIKSQGKSAPMAASKAAPKKPHFQDPIFGSKPISDSKNGSVSGSGSLFNDQIDDVFGFGSSNGVNNYGNSDVFDDVFQVNTTKSGSFSGGGGFGFDVESVFNESLNLNSNSNSSLNLKGLSGVDDDLIWGLSGSESNLVSESGDLLSSDPVEDFFGNLGKSGSSHRGSGSVGLDDLIPGFGRSNGANDRAQAASTEKGSGSFIIEELEDFVSGGTKKTVKGHVNGTSVKKEEKMTVSKKSVEANFIDIEGSLNGDSVYNYEVENTSEKMFPEEAFDLDSFFPAYSKSIPVTEHSSMNRNTDEVPDLFPETATRMEKKVSPWDFPDDSSPIIGVAPTRGVLERNEGENDKRQRLKFEREQSAMARAAEALENLKQREYQAQQEREEKHRIAEAMDVKMKRWAAGKEGNLRALVSSLEQVLPPELGWRPVTLTDLITSSQVKLAYKKAALYVHPDKVQHASPQQKYVAEKAFDLLKEAWNKFNAEELR